MIEKFKVCCYCRVSTDSKDQENSYSNQQSYFKNVLDNNNDCILTSIYADQGLTGTKLNNRPEFNKMLKDAGIDIIEHYTSNDRRVNKKHILYELSERIPLFQEIWIKNTSRFARNTLSFEIITKLRNKGVHVKFIEQNINTKDIGADFLLKLFQVFDEQDSRDKSLKVKTGIKEGARKGVISTNSMLYGYNYIVEENRLEIIPEEAEVIKKIFELYSKNYGARKIINYLKDNNIKTRSKKDFAKSTVMRIISNEKYVGINARLKYDTGTVLIDKHYPKLRDESEWIVSNTDKIPVVIDDELFKKCQDIRNSKLSTINQKGVYRGYSEYAQLIKCHKCGSNYTRNSGANRVVFYNCSNKKRNGVKSCDSPNISLKELEDAIEYEMKVGYVKTLNNRKNFYIKKLIQLKEKLNQRLSADLDNVVELEKNQLDKIIEKRKLLFETYSNGNISEEDYSYYYKEYSEEIKNIEKSIYENSKNNKQINEDIQKVEEAIKIFNTLKRPFETKEEFMNQLLYIFVTKDKKIIFGNLIDRTINDIYDKYIKE